MVPVEVTPFVERQLGPVAIVGIHVHTRDRAFAETLDDASRERALAGSGTARDADDQRFHAPKFAAAITRVNCPRPSREPPLALLHAFTAETHARYGGRAGAYH